MEMTWLSNSDVDGIDFDCIFSDNSSNVPNEREFACQTFMAKLKLNAFPVVSFRSPSIENDTNAVVTGSNSRGENISCDHLDFSEFDDFLARSARCINECFNSGFSSTILLCCADLPPQSLILRIPAMDAISHVTRDFPRNSMHHKNLGLTVSYVDPRLRQLINIAHFNLNNSTTTDIHDIQETIISHLKHNSIEFSFLILELTLIHHIDNQLYSTTCNIIQFNSTTSSNPPRKRNDDLFFLLSYFQQLKSFNTHSSDVSVGQPAHPISSHLSASSAWFAAVVYCSADDSKIERMIVSSMDSLSTVCVKRPYDDVIDDDGKSELVDADGNDDDEFHVDVDLNAAIDDDEPMENTIILQDIRESYTTAFESISRRDDIIDHLSSSLQQAQLANEMMMSEMNETAVNHKKIVQFKDNIISSLSQLIMIGCDDGDGGCCEGKSGGKYSDLIDVIMQYEDEMTQLRRKISILRKMAAKSGNNVAYANPTSSSSISLVKRLRDQNDLLLLENSKLKKFEKVLCISKKLNQNMSMKSYALVKRVQNLQEDKVRDLLEITSLEAKLSRACDVIEDYRRLNSK